MKVRLFSVLAILLIASMVFSACAAPMPAGPAGDTGAPGGEEAAPSEDLTRPHPMLSDVKVRQAIAHCIDRDALISSVYTYVPDDVKSTLRMDSFLPKTHWAYSGPYQDYEYSVEKGGALLEEAGWTDSDGDGLRDKDGRVAELTLTTTNAQFRQTWAAVVEQQLRDCGILIIRQHTPASWWFGDTTGTARRDYELGAFAWVGEADPGGRTLYACDQIPTPGNNWEGQNGMGWCNEAASNSIVQANNTLNRDERIAAYNIVQTEFAKDMVSLPLFQRAEAEAWGLNLQGLVVSPTEYGTASADKWALSDGGDTIVVGFSQEPASMFSLVEQAAVQRQIAQMGIGVVATQHNYDFQPVLQDGLSTIESGLATNTMVKVKAGDTVYSKEGAPVTLEQGVEVLINGETVVYDGSSELEMPELAVTYKFKPYTWSDGTPGSNADFELAYKLNCDKESGATEFNLCDSIASIAYGEGDALEHTVTYLPGVQWPTYFVANWGTSGGPVVYPSHQVLSDGRTLADVPANEWSTLPEIAEKPLSYGPFMISEWIKGQSLTLEKNPYYWGGETGVDRITVVFIQDTNQLVAQLLAGDLDYVEKATLAGGAEVQLVADAAAEGKINFEILPSPTWEHIDMNMFIKEK